MLWGNPGFMDDIDKCMPAAHGVSREETMNGDINRII